MYCIAGISNSKVAISIFSKKVIIIIVVNVYQKYILISDGMSNLMVLMTQAEIHVSNK